MKNYYPIACLALSAVTFTNTAHAGFFGPRTVTLTLSPAVLQEKLHGQPLVFAMSAAPLEFKSKSAAVGGFIFGFVMSSALASGGNSMRPGMSAQQNMQNMQQVTKLGSEVGSGIGKVTADLINAQGAKAAGMQAKDGPLPWLAPQLQAAFMQAYGTQWRAPLAKGAKSVDVADDPKMSLSIVQSVWAVDFSMASSDYSLNYKIDMKLTDLATKAINRSVACEGVFDKVMPEDDWKKDDFKAVADASKTVADLCLDKFLGDLNIARVIPVTASEAMDAAAGTSTPLHVVEVQTLPADSVAQPQETEAGKKQ